LKILLTELLMSSFLIGCRHILIGYIYIFLLFSIYFTLKPNQNSVLFLTG